MNTITVDSVNLSLGGMPILKDISFSINDDHVVCLLGANGSGKTTLVKTILGLYRPQRGSIHLLGQSLAHFTLWDQIGYAPQRSSLSLHSTTVAEIVGTGTLARRPLGWIRPHHRRQVMEALDIVGLSDKSSELYLHLSGGQQQRVLIARAIVNRPRLVLLDEPFAGVDISSQSEIAQALTNVTATLLVVLHETTALSSVIDRVLILREGHLVYDGTQPGEHTASTREVIPPQRTHLLSGMEPTWNF